MSKPETSGSFSAFSKLSIETLSHIASFFDPMCLLSVKPSRIWLELVNLS